MEVPFKVGDKISLVAVNQKSRRLSCVGTIIRIEGAWPTVRINDLAFKNPPELQLVPVRIKKSPQGFVYAGEIGGAVLIPDFLWVSP